MCTFTFSVNATAEVYRLAWTNTSPVPPVGALASTNVSIDLNSDLGDGVGEDPQALDEALLSVVTSANVACGGHAGDRESMMRVSELATARRVAIGAHISYDDRDGFGRESNGVSMEILKEQLLEQIATLDEIAHAAGSAVTYVKAHGQLYHQACIPGSVEAQTIIDAVREYQDQTDRQLAILGFAGSDLVSRAQAEHIKAVNEAFADRSYTAEGWLVARTEPGALITDPNEALGRLKRLLRDREIVAIDGTPIDVRADSICIHGDTPGAVVLARRVRAAIDSDRVKIAPFAPPPRAA